MEIMQLSCTTMKCHSSSRSPALTSFFYVVWRKHPVALSHRSMPASSSCPLFLSTHTWQSVLEPFGSQGAHALNSDGTEHSVLEPPFVLHALSDLGQLTDPCGSNCQFCVAGSHILISDIAQRVKTESLGRRRNRQNISNSKPLLEAS